MPSPITIVSVHAEGEVGNVIIDGVAPPPGDTLWQQMEFLQSDGHLRELVLNEPRGGVYCHVNMLVPPKDPSADFGFVIMEPEHTPPMSGSNTICVATVLLEEGLFPMQEPITGLTLEVPAGLVPVRAFCENGKAQSIEFTNVASFADKLDIPLELEGFGTLTVDTAFGGDSFVLIHAKDLGFGITPDEARDLTELGAKITKAANDQIGFRHPETNWNNISFCQFTNPVEVINGTLTGKSTVVVDPGKLDRSPCGTGCSARFAVMHARGHIAKGDPYIGHSIIDSRFDCRIVEETSIQGRPAIRPAIRGRAWLTGKGQIWADPNDPWQTGYRLSDTWPLMP